MTLLRSSVDLGASIITDRIEAAALGFQENNPRMTLPCSFCVYLIISSNVSPNSTLPPESSLRSQ